MSTTTKTTGVTDETAITDQKITVTVARLGGATLVKEFDQGTQIGSVLAEIGAVGLEFRVNKKAVKHNYVLQDNDLIVIVPEAIVGGC